MEDINPILSLFNDKTIIEKIRKRLPHLFYLAELDASRAGKVGMEIGSVRERIIIALLMYKFGEENINIATPITEPEIDVIVYDTPISIKTISGSRIGGVKAIWTVDQHKAKEFIIGYKPKCDIILVQVNYGGVGIFAFIPLSVQENVLNILGREKYFTLPKQGTNPRGVEFSKTTMHGLISNDCTKKIEIDWFRPTGKFNVYQRWLDYWKEN